MQARSRLRLLGLTLAVGLPLVAAAENGGKYQHVLLLSIDGMHAVDFENCRQNGSCPTLSELASHGLNYTRTSTSKPSDSFPGLMSIVTGGSPKTVGAFYDVAYDRVLAPPVTTTGNGVAGGGCTTGLPNGTTTEFDEGIDIDQTKLNGGANGAAATEGGVASIDADRLPRDPMNHCKPVYPWNFVRTNTIFGVIHAAGGYTAWSDKHPSYSSVAGPGTSSANLDDYYSPEINSSVVALAGVTTATGVDCSKIPDTTADQTAWTNSFANIQCYDTLKVNAIVNEIDGRNHQNTHGAPVPAIFGMNFQAVSVGQKLIDKTKSPVATGGYVDAQGTPTTLMRGEISFVDASIGRMVQALDARGLRGSTLIIVTAKHGQSPIDPERYVPQLKAGSSPATVLANAGCLPASESPLTAGGIGPTEDDISQIWLNSSCSTQTAVQTLQAAASELAIDEIFYDASLTTLFHRPGLPPDGDSRTPDIIVQPNIGHTYTGSTSKQSEHGGFAFDDTNVMLLVSAPKVQRRTLSTFVETMQVAPTVLRALGLDPDDLQAVRIEGTPVLPGLFDQ